MDMLLWLYLENIPHRQTKIKSTIKCPMSVPGMYITGATAKALLQSRRCWMAASEINLHDPSDLASLPPNSKPAANSSA